jgi:hypothetical protein
LCDQAIKAEQQRHSRRLQAIVQMHDSLMALDSHMPELQRLGAALDIAHVYPTRHGRHDCLHLCGDYWGDSNRTYSALLQAGFAELHAERVTYGSFTSVLLHHGALFVQMHISTPVARANPAPGQQPETAAPRASTAPQPAGTSQAPAMTWAMS